MKDVYITRMGGCLPNAPVENTRMEAILGQAGAQPSRTRRLILRSNGIRKRHYALDPDTGALTHTNASMTAEAVRALDCDWFDHRKMDLLCCGTSSPDQHLPNHAVMVHGELGGAPCEAVCTSGICMAGVTAMKHAWLSVRGGEHKTAVATGSELASTYMRGGFLQRPERHGTQEVAARPELAFETDFLRWMLSDGAGAVLMQDRPAPTGPSLRIDWIETISYAHILEPCMYAGATKRSDGSLIGWREHLNEDTRDTGEVLAVKQDVRLLNENIVRYAAGYGLTQVMEKHPLTADRIDWFLPHYSSAWFRDKLQAEIESRGLNIPMERWFSNLATRGNTGSASIYLMLEELFHAGRLKSGDTLLCFVPESGRFSTSYMHMTVT